MPGAFFLSLQKQLSEADQVISKQTTVDSSTQKELQSISLRHGKKRFRE